MRALVGRGHGTDSLEVIEAPIPEPGPGQVRIKVAAAAVNPVDLATSNGVLADIGLTAPRLQVGLGWDVAGTVDAVGPALTRPAVGSAGTGSTEGREGVSRERASVGVGRAVVGLADLIGRGLKTHAEYVVLDVDAVVPAPVGLELVAASSFALNGLTAKQALDALQLEPGQTVLVTGAAGGVGGYAVELAKHRGLTVIAAAGQDDEELVRRLGADYFVPRSADLATAVRDLVPQGVDGLVDAAIVGIGAQEAVRNGGAHAHLVAGPPPAQLRGIRVSTILVHANSKDLAELVSLVEAGALSTRVAGTYSLDDAATAYGRLAKGGVRGRLVLIP